MTLHEVLSGLLATRGVRSVAVAGGDGIVLEAVGGDEADLERATGLIAAGLASGRALADLFGDGDLVQATIEYERGPVLLAPLGDPEGGHVVVVVMDDLDSLGRVRLALRRTLPDVEAAVTAA